VADRLREGGWAVISQVISSELHLHLGQLFQLPTPSGAASFRLAATVSNYGWMSGTVLLNANDYARLWHSTRAGELAVTLKPGISIAQGKRAVQRALGPNSALTVQTATERQTQVTNVLANTLARLKQTSIIVLLAAVATVIAMMIAAIWQRRGRLDALMAIGMSTGQLARLVFYETGCVLLCGCILGIASGLAGQYLTDNWLIHTTGSPVAFNPAWQLGLRTLLAAVAISLAAAAIAVTRTVGFRPQAAFSTE
ncbi:MAG: ABC transporter permease, partial [Solirubrobacteraceae bacterium]